MTDREALIAILARFFLHEWENDSVFVGEWLEKQDYDPEEVVSDVDELLKK